VSSSLTGRTTIFEILKKKKMRKEILSKLNDIEKEYNIEILYACESGSRGWEFASPDSDYDVRFIFVRPIESYLSIADADDNLSFPINGKLDVYGWDIRKVLKLIAKSNTTPFEWLQSPIVYREKEGFRDELWAMCQHYFNKRNNMHHYLGIAKGALDTMTGNEIKVKKLFYVLRPLLAAKWCLVKNTIAPMRISQLLEVLPEQMHAEVAELIALKLIKNEAYTIELSDSLKSYIFSESKHCNNATFELEKTHFSIMKLDAFFRRNILKHKMLN
jgi:predicted nucleotidyltransferase